ncbi:MAG: glycosyl hydrolase family 28-related protein [Verrucomicrobiota bacterium]|nr:glycosyl hydrolase family 28-related protein [Verrucomicrobiota bacterium]
MRTSVFVLQVFKTLIAAVLAVAIAELHSGESAARVTEDNAGTFNVRAYGARGDGVSLDTDAINQAIAACSEAGGGKVLFPPGRYLTGTVRLKSRVTVFLDAGAALVGTTNLAMYSSPQPPDYMPEARWGKWHNGLVVGENLEDVTIAGPGVIDGNKVFDPTGEERMRGPHTIVFVNCKRFRLRDVTIVDSANYAVFFQVSDQVEVQNVKFIGGWDGIHFRGAPHRPCRGVMITGCLFQTGDDSIAGRYWDNVVISGCIVNSSCNGLRLIGPATRLIVHNCLFYGPGEQPHRTSGAVRRTNMLSGIILQPGAWDATLGQLDDVLISDVTMQSLASPLTLWLKRGNTAGRVAVERLSASGVYRAPISVESWWESPVTNVVFRDVTVQYDGGVALPNAVKQVTAPGVDARSLPVWGFYARNVETLTLENVRLTLVRDDARPVIAVEKARCLNLDAVKYTRVPGVTDPVVLTNVAKANVRETDLDGHVYKPRPAAESGQKVLR